MVTLGLREANWDNAKSTIMKGTYRVCKEASEAPLGSLPIQIFREPEWQRGPKKS